MYSSAYQFWRPGATKDIEALCDSDALEEQGRIWRERLRPILLKLVVGPSLKSPVFCCNPLGVPLNQRPMILKDRRCYDYVKNMVDPVAEGYLFKTGSNFYLSANDSSIIFTGSAEAEYMLFSTASWTLYPCFIRTLSYTRRVFEVLKKNMMHGLWTVSPHTDSIANVVRSLFKESLTRTLDMDHLDRFSPGTAEVDEEVKEPVHVTAPGVLAVGVQGVLV